MPPKQKATGSHYTPPELARFLAERLVAEADFSQLPELRGPNKTRWAIAGIAGVPPARSHSRERGNPVLLGPLSTQHFLWCVSA